MANVVANLGVGGATFATDEIAGVLHPRSKLVWGVAGVATDASATDPLPVVQTGTPGLPTGAATAANQTTELASLASIDGKLTSGIPIVGSVEVMNDAGNPLPVNGTVSVTGVATAANQATEIASLASVDGKTPALGQALAAASTPVVLTAIQQAALTPPAAIAGFALEAGNLASILAALGAASVDTAAAGTMLSFLAQLGKKMDANTTAVVAQTKTLVSALPKPIMQRSGTLLHRN